MNKHFILLAALLGGFSVSIEAQRPALLADDLYIEGKQLYLHNHFCDFNPNYYVFFFPCYIDGNCVRCFYCLLSPATHAHCYISTTLFYCCEA